MFNCVPDTSDLRHSGHIGPRTEVSNGPNKKVETLTCMFFSKITISVLNWYKNCPKTQRYKIVPKRICIGKVLSTIGMRFCEQYISVNVFVAPREEL